MQRRRSINFATSFFLLYFFSCNQLPVKQCAKSSDILLKFLIAETFHPNDARRRCRAMPHKINAFPIPIVMCV